MSLASLAPVFLRELRLSRRRTGHWRSNWRWLLGTCIGCAALIVAMNVHGMNIVNLVQFVGFLAGSIIALMPLGFAADRQAGQQSLLRLTGLGPVQVFGASAAGSLYAVLELWLCCVPLLLIGFSIARTRPASALLAIACVGAMFLWLGSLRILGAAASRTRSGMVLISLVAGAGLVLPAVLDFWLGHRLSPGAGQILHLLGGAESWMGFPRAIRPRGPTAPLWSVLGRLLVWSFLLLSIAAGFFRSDWLQNESGVPVRSRWRHWLQTRLKSPNRRSPESNPYLARYPESQGWVRAQWTLAALIGVGGLGACALSAGSPSVRMGAATCGLLMIIVWLVVSEQFASSRGLSEEDLRLVAAAPLPTEECIPKDNRTTRPWVPEGFQR